MKPNPNAEWWEVLRGYISSDAWEAFLNAFHRVFSTLPSSSVLSAIVHVLGVYAFVTHRLVEKFSAADKKLDAQLQGVNDLTARVQSCRDLVANTAYEFKEAAKELRESAIPWRRFLLATVPAIALTGFITGVVTLNIDRLSFLRIPVAREQLLQEELDRTRDELSKAKKIVLEYSTEMDQIDVKVQQLKQQEYIKGYRDGKQAGFELGYTRGRLGQ